MDDYMHITTLALTENLIYLASDNDVWVFPGKEGLCYMEAVRPPFDDGDREMFLELYYLDGERRNFCVPTRFWDDLVSWMRATGFNNGIFVDKWAMLVNSANIESSFLDDEGMDGDSVIIIWKDGCRLMICLSTAESLRIPIIKEEQNERE